MICLTRSCSQNSRSCRQNIRYFSSFSKIDKCFLKISDEVQEAILSKSAVVALESTIITHGMPFPQNYSTAFSVQEKVRQQGVVPATVAVLNGKLCVGLSNAELSWLAEKNSTLVKVSRRDLSFVLSRGLSGGTTVSATMIAASRACIPIFATGGIGGVHRGAEISFDVSADLTELSRTPVAVVSSGVKSILDIPKTLEYLETQGVPVMTFGGTCSFPAFFTKDSGYHSPYHVSTHYEAAKIIDVHLRADLNSGMLIAVPIPEEFSAAGEVIHEAIQEAVELARKNEIKGKEVTPYILNLVNQLTEGQSLKANIALVENNAVVAASIARCLAQIRAGVSGSNTASSQIMTSFSTHNKFCVAAPRDELDDAKPATDVPGVPLPGRPVVIGATVVDFSIQLKQPNLQFNGATYQGTISQSFGGVGRNIADCLTRLNCNPVFISAVGNDSLSNTVFQSCSHMDLSSVQTKETCVTATYCPVLQAGGQLLFGVGNMDINSSFHLPQVSSIEYLIKSAPLVVLDGNFSSDIIQQVVQTCVASSVPVWFEPTDVFKCIKPFDSEVWKQLTFISPNIGELCSMYETMQNKLGQNQIKAAGIDEQARLEDILTIASDMCRTMVEYIPVILVTLGKHGVLLCHSLGDVPHLLPVPDVSKIKQQNKFKAVFYRAPKKENRIVSVSGAGDCLASAFIAAMLRGSDPDVCVKQGLLAALLSLESISAVPDTVTSQAVAEPDLSGLFVQWQPKDLSRD